MSPIQEVSVCCPHCAHVYTVYWPASTNGSIRVSNRDDRDRMTSDTCPECGFLVDLHTILRRWREDGASGRLSATDLPDPQGPLPPILSYAHAITGWSQVSLEEGLHYVDVQARRLEENGTVCGTLQELRLALHFAQRRWREERMEGPETELLRALMAGVAERIEERASGEAA